MEGDAAAEVAVAVEEPLSALSDELLLQRVLDDDVRQEVSARLKTLRTKNEQLEAERDNSRRAFEDVAAISVAAAEHITQGQGAQQAHEQHAQPSLLAQGVDWMVSLATVGGGLAFFWEENGGFQAALAPVSSLASTASWLRQGAETCAFLRRQVRRLVLWIWGERNLHSARRQ